MVEGTVNVFLFLPFFFVSLVAGDDECSYSRCGKEETKVQFPFALEGHQDRSCGFPGFSLSCDKSNRTVIDFGESGKFLVRFIDYLKQEVQIYDQSNCLSTRLLENLDLTATPFGGSYQNFSFYNCSSNFSSNFFNYNNLEFVNPISCLSTPAYTVYAAPPFDDGAMMVSGTCEIYATAKVPMWQISARVWYLPDINEDLPLLWDTPNCGECFARGGTCRFSNRNKNEIGCFGLPRKVGLSKTAKYVLGLGIGAPGLLFLILVACCISGRLKSLHQNNNIRQTELSSSVLPEPLIFIVGLDEAVIQSYPKTVLGESRRLAKPEDNICSICLSEYRAKEILKTIPDCKHCFHAACIDQWLHRNVTCPLCRKAPQRLPMPPPV